MGGICNLVFAHVGVVGSVLQYPAGGAVYGAFVVGTSQQLSRTAHVAAFHCRSSCPVKSDLLVFDRAGYAIQIAVGALVLVRGFQQLVCQFAQLNML